ncbi:MAG: NTP transferase domain-containing protein [Fibrobacter sp.]|nr:NTP transferase domain-containing protein [Fibrobacter sp.]
MRGFVLAAGFGTRLRPITDHIPKALVPVAGKPLLERSLNFLIKNGIDTIGVNSHYLSEQIDAFRRKSVIPFTIYHEAEIRGTGGALDNARDFLSSDTFVIVNVDIVCEFDLAALINRFNESGDICALVSFAASGSGTVCYNRNNGKYLGTVSESPDTSDTESADFIGIAMYRPEFLSLLTDDDFSIVPVWTRALKQGLPVSVYIVEDGYWRDTGKPQDLADLHFDILDGKISIDISSEMELDTGSKTCVYKGINRNIVQTGPYSWIEPCTFNSSDRIERCVIFKGAEINNTINLHSSLITQWGAFDLHV